jgi:hypothetical protein
MVLNIVYGLSAKKGKRVGKEKRLFLGLSTKIPYITIHFKKYIKFLIKSSKLCSPFLLALL